VRPSYHFNTISYVRARNLNREQRATDSRIPSPLWLDVIVLSCPVNFITPLLIAAWQRDVDELGDANSLNRLKLRPF
jgi:hypothetical protein